MRGETSNDSCTAVIDTPNGPIKCLIKVVLGSQKGNRRLMMSSLYEMDSGEIQNIFYCSPHPDVFKRN